MHPRKDQPWAWKSVVGAFLGFFLSISIDLSYSIIFKEVKSYYGVNSTIASSLFGLIIGVRLLLSPVAVVVINLLGCDKTAMFGGGLVGLGLFIASCSSNMPLFFFSYGFLTGIGISFVYTSTMVILSENFNKRKALAFGIASSGSSLANMLFPHLFAVIVVHYEFRSALMILSAFTLNLVVTGLLFVRPGQCVVRTCDKTRFLDPPDSRAAQPARRKALAKVLKESIFNIKPLKNVEFICFTVGISWFFLGVFPWWLYIVDILRATDGINLNSAVLTFTVEGVSQAVSRLSSGVWLDRASIRPFRGVVCAACCLVSGLCCAIVAAVEPSLLSYLAISAVRGFVLGVLISQNVVILGDLVSASLIAISIGILSFLKGVGCVAGPVLSGAIRDNFNSYLETFLFLAINQCLAGCLILYPFLRKLTRKSDSPLFINDIN